MFEINPFDLIPEEFKLQARDALVDFVTEQAKKYLSDEISTKLKALRSDGAFNRQFDEGLQRATQRFFAEYEGLDEDLVVAIKGAESFFQNEEIQKALLAMIKKPGAYLAEENEQVQLSFESVLPQRKNRERVNRAITYLLKCLAQEVWHLPELQSIYSLQFQRMTAEATRQSVNLQQAQLDATRQMGAELRQGLVQLTEAMEKKLLSAPTLAAIPLPRLKPYHNLPRPDYTCFVGRDAELAWLRNRLRPRDRAWQIAITGIGGVGKSALALAIAHEYREQYDQLPPDERFDAIIWISAKEEILTAQGREKASLPEQVLHTLEDGYTSISRVLDRDDITRALPADQDAVVEKALKEQRTLLIMDNLESVKDDRIKAFLRNLPEPTKAIITSREWLDVADVRILKGMQLDDAEQLILGEAAARQINLDVSERQRIYDLTSGLPLPIRLAVARLAGGEKFRAVERWLGNAIGDLPEYCIQGQAELARQRNINAWKLVLACSLFDRAAGASRDALRHVADLTISDCDDGITALKHLFLINQTENDRFWVLPIVHRYASTYLANPSYGDLVERWLEWLTQFSQMNGAALELKIERKAEFSLEYPNLLNAIRWCREHDRWNTLYKLAEWTWSYPYILSLFHEFDEIVDAAQSAAQMLCDEQKMGRIELCLGRIDHVRGNFERAIEHLVKAEKIALRYKDDYCLILAWYTLSYIYIHGKRIRDVERIADELLSKGDETGNVLYSFWGACRFSEVEAIKQNPEKAIEWLSEAECFAKQLDATRLLISLPYRRALIHIDQEDYITAEPYMAQALEMNAIQGASRYVAENKYYLAQIYFHTGRVLLAKQFCDEANKQFQRLGMSHHSKKAEDLLEMILKSPEIPKV